MRILNTENIKEVEKIANDNGISYLQMMENAGAYCARIIRQTFDKTNKRKVLVVCGKGNNGGDGFVIARKLKDDGYNVVVMLSSGITASEEASEMLSSVKAMGITVIDFNSSATVDMAFTSSQIIVDCIFGIGFKGEADDVHKQLFKKINESSATVVSVDLPSGLNGNSSFVPEDCVKADMTIAVMALKPVHVFKSTKEVCGEIVTAPIGISEKMFSKVNSLLFTADEKDIKEFIPKRKFNSHKGTYGTVLFIGGSYEMPNAICLASKAAVNSGAGLVKVAFPAVAYSAIAPKTLEQTLVPLESNKNGRISQNSIKRIEKEIQKCSCIVLGCGMGTDDDTKKVTEFVIRNAQVPLILDADGINCLKDNIDILKEAKAQVILTPHPKEFSRIVNETVENIEATREFFVQTFTKEYNTVLVLKGSATLVGCKEYDDIYINSTGNPGMATGGSGDLLAGFIGSLIAQGIDCFESAVAGVYIHGALGDDVSEKYSMMGNTPSLMLSEMPAFLNKFE